MPKREDGGDVLVVGRVESTVSGGTQDGQVQRLAAGLRQKSCFALGGLVLDQADEVSEPCCVPHRGNKRKRKKMKLGGFDYGFLTNIIVRDLIFAVKVCSVSVKFG